MTMKQNLTAIALMAFVTAFLAAEDDAAVAGADAAANRPIEVVALIDHYDFAAIPDPDNKGRYLFDTESAEGCDKLLEHVLLTGSQTVLWRPESGSMMRYHSKEEGFLIRRGFDKRRTILSQEPVYTWVRYAESEVDNLHYGLNSIRRRGLCCGLHWPFEETHWATWTFGPYNLDHPQYWGRTQAGIPWPGRISLAYPEAMEHKMRVVDELMEMKPEVIFIDTWRNGGWGPKYEYVPPMVNAWKERYGTEPPPADDLRWCQFVSETIHGWYRRLRARMDQQVPRPRLLVGFQLVDRGGSRDQILRTYGIDWPKLVDEGLVDGIVVMGANWDVKRPLESTREIFQDVMAICNGRCQVFFPVQAYNFTHKGLEEYAKYTGLTQGQVTAELCKMTRELGAQGVVLEVVDYKNYRDDVCQALRDAAQGK